MPNTFYAVVGTMRSGSTLLCRMLEQAGLGKPDEYLNGNQGALNDIAAITSHITKHQPGPYIGIKLLAFQLHERLNIWQAWTDWTPESLWQALLDNLQPDVVRYVALTRRDTLAQAVSAYRAETLGRWMCGAHDTPHRRALPQTPESVVYVEAMRDSLDYGAVWIDDFMAAIGTTPLRLVYEDFTATEDTIRQTVQRVSEYIGHELPPQYDNVIPLKKQAGEFVEDWIAWYHAR